MDFILFCESPYDIILMFINSSNEIISDANVQRAISLACQYVDIICAHDNSSFILDSCFRRNDIGDRALNHKVFSD